MNLLLDTHVVLWWLAGESLSDAATAAISDPDHHVVVSAASVWEIAIKRQLGKLRVEGDLVTAISADFDSLAVTFAHADAAGGLPLHHRDPFDRMLIAQSQLDDFTVVTRDQAFDAYEVDVLAA